MNDAYCPMIHGGLRIDLKVKKDKVYFNHCCLRAERFEDTGNLWTSEKLQDLRLKNLQNIVDPGCFSCTNLEQSGLVSLRQATIKKVGTDNKFTGPIRLDLMFDNSCNLACRTCSPKLSSYWQKHLTENKISHQEQIISETDKMISILESLNLENLQTVVLCGGETLLGTQHWRVVESLAKLAPKAKEKLQVSFQTNATQRLPSRYHDLIEKFQLVKLNFSLDGVGERFDYLRWPAKWEQVTENIKNIANTCPTNVMFIVEETVNIFNWYYTEEMTQWVANNFSTNRLGDQVNHGKHLAFGIFSIENATKEYIAAMRKTRYGNMISNSWQENPERIKEMITQIDKFDKIRNQDWKKTFPEVAGFYSRYI